MLSTTTAVTVASLALLARGQADNSTAANTTTSDGNVIDKTDSVANLGGLGLWPSIGIIAAAAVVVGLIVGTIVYCCCREKIPGLEEEAAGKGEDGELRTIEVGPPAGDSNPLEGTAPADADAAAADDTPLTGDADAGAAADETKEPEEEVKRDVDDATMVEDA